MDFWQDPSEKPWAAIASPTAVTNAAIVKNTKLTIKAERKKTVSCQYPEGAFEDEDKSEGNLPSYLLENHERADETV